jgi:hypothetical protein
MDYAPIGLVATTPFVIVVTSALPVKSIAELIAYAKAKPGQLMYASGGTWTSTHVCLEQLQQMAGVKKRHVPYKGLGIAMADLMSGQVQLACPPAPTMTVVPAGKVRVLGVTSLGLSQLAPGVPPIAQTLAGFEMPGWYGAVAPKGTPRTIVARDQPGARAHRRIARHPREAAGGRRRAVDELSGGLHRVPRPGEPAARQAARRCRRECEVSRSTRTSALAARAATETPAQRARAMRTALELLHNALTQMQGGGAPM